MNIIDDIDLTRIINEVQLRNLSIRSFWRALSYTDLSYKQKQKITMNHYCISKSLLDVILSRKQ